MASPAQAQSIVTAPNLDSVLQAHIAAGDTTAQENRAPVNATTTDFDAVTAITGVSTGVVFENNENTAEAIAVANRNGVSASLATIGSSTLLDDGIALSGVSLNTGAVTATNTGADIGITGIDFATGSVDVSNNTTSATAVLNEGSDAFAMSITGSEPVGYTNLATTNATVTSDLSGSAANVADLSGTLMVSSVQDADAAADSSATTANAETFLNLSTTVTADITGTATLDGNAVTSSFTANARDASIGLAADDASTSVTAVISNAQRYDANTTLAAASTTGTTISSTIDEDATAAGGTTTSFVDSSLSIASNEVTADAKGNTATTAINLADGLAYNTVAGNTGNAAIDENDATPAKLADLSATAGLVGVNTQLVEDGSLVANTSGTDIEADVQGLETSSIEMVGNRIIASVMGNDLTASIASGSSAAVFDASAVLASRQELDNADVIATASNNDLLAMVGYGNDATFADSAITLDSNVQAASATGNRGRQSIELEATALNASNSGTAVLAGDLTVGSSETRVSADGAVVVASAMLNTDSAVSASNTDASIEISAGDNLNQTATDTSTAVTNNVQQAFAAGSDAGNSLSLTGVDVGSGAGISNLQINDATSTVSATQDAEVLTYYDWSLEPGSGEISGNSQSAIARGTVAANTLAVEAQTVAQTGLGGDAATTDLDVLEAVANAGFGVANVQQVLADVTAETIPDRNNAYLMEVYGDVDGSTTAVNSNTVMAQAQGTVAANAITLDVGTMTSAASEGDAAIANLQNVAGADILATARGDGLSVVRTIIGDDVFSSSVETSTNRIMASAESARATNTLSVSATSISGSAIGGQSDADPTADDNNTVNAQFAVANTQIAGAGNVTASLRDSSGGSFNDSAAVFTIIGDDVSSSSVASNGNLLQALASSNKSTNAVSVDGNALSQVTSGLGNVQVSEQDVSALVGFAGSAPVAPFTVNATITGGTASGNVTGLTPAQISAFVSAYSGTPGWTYNAGTGAFSYTTIGSGAVTIPVNGTAGSYNSGGVLVEVDSEIQSSSIAVESNAVQGSAIGNSAANSVNVAATTVEGTTTSGFGEVFTASSSQTSATANADASLASTQLLVPGSSSTTEVFTTFGIDAGTDNVISDSNLSVSGNSLYGEAIGNTVSNSLTVEGTDLAGTGTSGVLSNAQEGLSASISASSDMEVVSNVVSSGSDIAIDGNVNNALGVVNNATNTLAASSTNSASTVQAFAVSEVELPNRAQSSASYALVNGQSASGGLTTSATSNVYNVGGIDPTTTGIVDGTVSASSNVTRGEATANRAANTLSVNADANLGSTAALLNQQNSSTTTVANASSFITLDVSGNATATPAALGSVDTSSVSVENNSTLALARGNSASNTLNYTAGATYTAQASNALVSGAASQVQADAALLNDQLNTGAVTANATSTTSVALNALSAGTSPGVLNGNVSNSNNSTTAFAVGNTAANTVMLSSLNTGMPNVALGNQQTNSGAVTAQATTVTYTMSSVGTVGASMFQNNGNAASATAIGNSSVSVIGAR